MFKIKQHKQGQKGMMKWMLCATMLLAFAFSGVKASAQDVTYITPDQLSPSTVFKIQNDGIYVLAAKAGGIASPTAAPTNFDGYIQIASGKNVTLYLNGHTLTCTKSQKIIENVGSLTLYGTYPGGNEGGIIDGYYANNTAVRSCGISQTNANTSILIDGVTIRNCNYTLDGGAISSTNGLLEIRNSVITDCSSASRGSGVFFNSSTCDLLVDNTTIQRCTSGDNGGAICKIGNSDFTITNSLIDDCKSNASGGGIFFGKFVGELEISNTMIRNCESNGHGGGICSNGEAIVKFINNSTIDGCVALNKFGGGIYIGESGKLTMENGLINECIANTGGGIFVNTSAEFTMNGGTISYCYAVKDKDKEFVEDGEPNGTGYVGGGVCVFKSTMNFNGGTITNCHAATGSGGVHTWTADGLLATFYINGPTCEITHCDAYSYAGCTHIGNGSHCFMYDGEVSYNTCHRGSINKNGGAFQVGYAAGSKFEIYGGKICHNRALAGDGGIGYGGGIFMRESGSSGGSIIIKGGEISDNYAANKGGGIYARISVTVDGASILRNEAGVDGGGIFFQNTCSYFRFLSGYISGNKAGNNGGGLYFDNFEDKSIELIRGVMNENEACNQGGGVYMVNSTITFGVGTDLVDFTKNSAKQGGGLFICNVNGKKDVTINNSSFVENTASDCGGGIYLDDNGKGTLSLKTGRTYFQNIAENDGGAIFVNNVQKVDVDNCSFAENEATAGRGGAVYIAKGAVNVNFCSAIGNTANDGGAFYTDGGALTIIGTCELSNNQANHDGGGFYVNGGNVTIGDDNSNIKVTSNKAYRHGGALYINGATNKVVFSSGNFSENIAMTGNGGAIAMRGGTMELNNGNVSFNQSLEAYGGGIALTNGAIFTMDGGDISYNDALLAGGGIYADGLIKNDDEEVTGVGGQLNFKCGKIVRNKSRNGGGVYAIRGITINLQKQGNVVMNYAYCDETAEPLTTAYHDNINNQGIGGGFYIGSGYEFGGHTYKTTLDFSGSKAETTAPGVFSNMANNGADDIYVSGDKTLITLPDINNVDFNNFDGNATGWFEDYVNSDTEYLTDGVNMNPNPQEGDPIRYRLGRLTATEKIFPVEPNTYENKYLCLTIGYVMKTWVTVVDNHVVTEGTDYVIEGTGADKTFKIKTENGLAWYISHITGFYGTSAEDVCPKATLENDLDMSAHIWVPIGYSGKLPVYGAEPLQARVFKGEFDGKGHTITGLMNMNVVPDANNPVYEVGDAGLFGYVGEGAVIKNTFVTDCDFMGVKKGYYGIIADTVCGGTIYNCEASGILVASLTFDNNNLPTFGGVVGLADAANIHSCIATCELEGYMEGGLVGKVGAGSKLENSFSNVKYSKYGTMGTYHAGGLADKNCGTIENCYVRFERDNNLGNMPLSLFADDNTSGSISRCFIPLDHDGQTLCDKGDESNVSSYATYDEVVAPYLYANEGLYDNVSLKKGSITDLNINTRSLLNTLNNWVETKGDNYAEWQRSTAGGFTLSGGEINDDFPIHKFADFTSVGTTDGIVLTYGSLDDELTRMNEATNGGTLLLYANEETSLSNDDNVIIYIGENVSLLHENKLEAYTCQTMTKGSDEYWHNISSSLTCSPIGICYGIKTEVPWEDDVQGGPNNPCSAFIIDDNELSLFPSDADIRNIDLYSFYEPEYHWINLKRNNLSHWHMNDHGQQIEYGEDDNLMGGDTPSYLIPGKGYLAAIDKEVLLQNHGELNSGLVEIMVTNEAPEGIDRKGLNLLGNPYQSYLDFEVFADEAYNPTLFSGEPSYLVFDASKNAYCQYKSGSSRGTEAASRYLNMHQGFFIHYTGGSPVKAKFTNDMRVKDAEGISFRDWTPEYALVNLTVRNEQEQGDIAVVELGRPVTEGAVKMKDISSGDAKISFRHDDEDYAVLFLSEETNEVPVRFECDGGTYTLTWSTANAGFSYLHLIDNMTGKDIDMLTSDGYTFTANADDYKSRFKMVFAYTGIGENEDTDTDTELAEAFAFFSNGDLIVSGKGNLQVIDMTGHVLYSTRLTDAQSRVSVPQVATGIYIVRLNEKVQKIVIK